ncbi:hypothetical protein [Lacticaseibacillus rhamnosus]
MKVPPHTVYQSIHPVEKADMACSAFNVHAYRLGYATADFKQ